MGVTSRYCSLPTPPLIPPALGGHATCHCWRWAKCRLSGSWGHDVQGVWLVSCGAPTNGAEECRLIRRTAVSSQTRSPRMGGNCWSRDLKVRRLLKPAELDRRLSLTPPISLQSISSADAHKAISVNTHFERGSEHRISSGAYLCARWVDRYC